MNFTDEALRILARQMGEDTVPSRAELEAKLTRLLSLILRTEHGHPSLVRWVRHHLAEVAPTARFGCPFAAKSAAPRLARLLCLQMLRSTRSHRDTVVSRRTVVAS